MKNDKLSQFIIKLIKLTKGGELIWTSFSPRFEELPNGEIIIDKIYEARLNERDFHLYRYKYKYYTDESEYEWSQRIRLELLDIIGNTDYEFEYHNSMDDLYDIVREQTSNVIDFIDDILGLKLEIIEAKYYTQNNSIDISEIVKNKVNNNRLVLDATNQIAGDPELNVPKKLKIKYQYAGVLNTMEVNEGQTIIIP